MKNIRVWDDYRRISVVDLMDKQHKDNPRYIEAENKARLTNALQDYGMLEPIIINTRTGNMLGGHQRLRILYEQNVAEVTALHIDVDPTVEKEILVILNDPSLMGQYDDAKLSKVINDIVSSKADVTGIDAVTNTSFLSTSEILIDSLIGQGYSIDLSSVNSTSTSLSEALIDNVLSKNTGGSGATFNSDDEDIEDDYSEDDYSEDEDSDNEYSGNEDSNSKKKLSKGKSQSEDITGYLDEYSEGYDESNGKQDKEAKINKIAADMNRRNNQKFLKLGITESQLEIVRKAFENMSESEIPDYLKEGEVDPFGTFITYCVINTTAHKNYQ